MLKTLGIARLCTVVEVGNGGGGISGLTAAPFKCWGEW